MNSRFLYMLVGITFLFISCHASEVNSNAQTRQHQIRNEANSSIRCVRSEGGYETNTYCITIFNTANLQQVPQPVKMLIKNKETKDIQFANGKEWLGEHYNMYGFRGKSRDKTYEIDWREEKTHFRIWDASHKKLLEDELVIVGPEDILKDILKDKSTNP